MFETTTPMGWTEDRTVLATTVLGVLALFVGDFVATGGLLTYYATQSGTAAGGVATGSGAVVSTAIAASSLSGLALAGAATGGVALVAGAAV